MANAAIRNEDSLDFVVLVSVSSIEAFAVVESPA
jgi:hypothetical protein